MNLLLTSTLFRFSLAHPRCRFRPRSSQEAKSSPSPDHIPVVAEPSGLVHARQQDQVPVLTISRSPFAGLNFFLKETGGFVYAGLFRFLAFALLIVITGAVNALAQSTFGSIVGNVRDPSGAVIPGAVITVRNEGTSAQRSTLTDESGSYAMLNLDAANYEVTVELPGFQRETYKIVLTARQVARLDAQLTARAASGHRKRIRRQRWRRSTRRFRISRKPSRRANWWTFLSGSPPRLRARPASSPL